MGPLRPPFDRLRMSGVEVVPLVLSLSKYEQLPRKLL